ncbi:hypothetical protein [Psychrobium sp. 1_MG-2023]|uniref:hypothetical protein n=1 Tax=Psychrobium sp. 1_MG-2023 TaxID=3062624 RepID=UPI000C322343|nr:hypothetical protein [Psychrobium sp. 1_MG-2023]MDP2559678.1 hypothetical protein [Psychrobium sp. 1_MG-2023]PKF59509.1 hypothetical protein CW748_01685 [Alteromonadales bacterium alter-6D02]
MIKFFLYLHLAGLCLIGVGLYMLLMTDASAQVSGMVALSSALGLGGVMISPYPVIKAIEWMKRQ